jgi:hypothetical protein
MRGGRRGAPSDQKNPEKISMTENNNTAADTAANADDAKKKGAPWVQRYGKLTSLRKRSSRQGEFVTFEIDCGKFTQQGVSFSPKVIEAMLAAGKGATIWAKGPIELREVKVNGAAHDEETFKAVFFKNKTKAPAAKGKAEETGSDEGKADEGEAQADADGVIDGTVEDAEVVGETSAEQADIENAFT